jgi:hypothetical protein
MYVRAYLSFGPNHVQTQNKVVLGHENSTTYLHMLIALTRQLPLGLHIVSVTLYLKIEQMHVCMRVCMYVSMQQPSDPS